MRQQPRPEKEKHLYRCKPQNRLVALKKYYPPEQRVALTVNGREALALLIAAEESIPYSAYCANKPMLVVYGHDRNGLGDESIPGALGTILVEKLERIRSGRSTRIQDIVLPRWTHLNAAQVERLRDLTRGRAPRLGVRHRLSSFAAQRALVPA